MKAINRILITFAFAIVTFLILLYFKVEVFTRIVISWDIFGLIMIVWLWNIFFKMDAATLRMHARIEDTSRLVSFFVVITSVIISLMGILIILHNKTKGMVNEHLHAPVSIIGVGISWFLLHSIFTIRYVHLFFGGSIVHDDIVVICVVIEYC